ncbi:helix-turn-helix domain-containing protein [Citricoccus sp. I39-566]|uniref:helix-turn-helix domain-containing protein n=1 Tax=Citricoccus sp. I39-566 TaxID=3073268 RepID=UPI00286ABAF8|nr:helix-turn-helix domain-containing protein [Citricoccus sp. I39-566]WMY79778.1 helix-turn-helix domain-containing protein [Citricoccus sp. I39-566]
MHSKRADPAAVFRELIEAASELSGIHGEESVLSSIVQRTRRLLAADMSYISFNDPATGVTFIRKSDGVMTAAFRTLQVPLNAGILGQVATGEAAFQTRDYFNDPTVPRKDDIDEVVRGEGVISIMGVPLVESGRVLGALMVAERTHRTYSPQDVDLVESFGRYSVVALANASHITGLKNHSDTLEHRQAELSQRSAQMQELQEVSSALRQQMMDEPSLQRLLDLLSSHLGLPVSLVDDSGELTWSTLSTPVPNPDPTTATATATDQSSMALPLTDATMGRDRGQLIAHGPCTDHQREILRVGGSYLTIALNMVRADEDAQLRRQQDVLADLLGEAPVPPERLALRLRPWRLSLTQRIWLAVVRNPDGTVPEALLRRLPHTVLAGTVQGEFCLVVDDQRWAQGAGQLAQEHRLVIAISGPWELGKGVRAGFQRARSHLNLMALMGTRGLQDSHRADLVYSLAALAQDGGIIEELFAPLAPVIAHDRTRRSQMTYLALTYFECDRRIDLTAETLHLHRNTVRQRLATLTKLLGTGWDHMPRALDLHVSLRAWASHGRLADEVQRAERTPEISL